MIGVFPDWEYSKTKSSTFNHRFIYQFPARRRKLTWASQDAVNQPSLRILSNDKRALAYVLFLCEFVDIHVNHTIYIQYLLYMTLNVSGNEGLRLSDFAVESCSVVQSELIGCGNARKLFSFTMASGRRQSSMLFVASVLAVYLGHFIPY